MNRLLRKGFILQLIGVVVTLSMTFSVGVASAEECAKEECPERAAMAESHIEFHCCLAEKAQTGDLLTRTRRELVEARREVIEAAMGGIPLPDIIPLPDTWCEFWDTPILYAPGLLEVLGGEGCCVIKACPEVWTAAVSSLGRCCIIKVCPEDGLRGWALRCPELAAKAVFQMVIRCYLAEWAARGELTVGELYKITGRPISNRARKFWDNNIQIGVGSPVIVKAEWAGPGEPGETRELPLVEGQSSGVTPVGMSDIEPYTPHGPSEARGCNMDQSTNSTGLVGGNR
ncbi:hypothetical protein M1O57_05585 [Dehalococcoidia bacterium]|nr:hypothetical protein [Dehalococcoidia bacterium]